MINISKEKMLSISTEAVSFIYDEISTKPSLNIKDIDINSSALVIIDVINGFVRIGNLKSERVEGIVGSIVDIQKYFVENSGEIIAFVDTHNEDASEFTSYPPHCVRGTEEAKVLPEIEKVGGYSIIEKNSTNGFIEKEFMEFLEKNNKIENFILVGCCTDICVMQFALTLKNYFNMINKNSRVIVPVNAVETFSLGSHSGDFVDLISLQLMDWAGVEVVSGIKV